MTKSGIAGLTRALAAEWARYDIQVNCIAPGFIVTDLNRQIWEQPQMLDWLKAVAVRPRPGRPGVGLHHRAGDLCGWRFHHHDGLALRAVREAGDGGAASENEPAGSPETRRVLI